MTRVRFQLVIDRLHDVANALTVALDAWLEAPRLSRNNTGWLIRAVDSTSGTLDEYGKREAAIRALIHLFVDAAATRRWPKGGWFNMGHEPMVRRTVIGFLTVLYADLRGDYEAQHTWHHRSLRASFGYEDERIESANAPDIMTPVWVGVEYLKASQEARDRLDECFDEVMRCVREAWQTVASVRAGYGSHGNGRVARDHHEFLVWVAQLGRPVKHVEVKSWIAVKRGRPADYNWGANDPAGPLLRRFCEKQGPPGSRAPWVLRPEALAWLHENQDPPPIVHRARRSRAA